MKLSCKLCRLPDCPRGPDTHWHVRDQYIGIVFSASTLAQCNDWVHKVFLPTFHEARRRREMTTGRAPSSVAVQNIPVRPASVRPTPRLPAPVRVLPIEEPEELEAMELEVVPNPAIEDVISALENLGMKKSLVRKVVPEVAQAHPTADFEELFRACLPAARAR